MNKLIFISSIAAPHQIKLCHELQNYFDTEFWFYDSLGERAAWWQVDLGDYCKIIPNVYFKSISKYFTRAHLSWLKIQQPDVLMLGGFSIPGNYLAYRWAKRNNIKTIIFTERSRDKRGKLRRRGLAWIVLRFLYQNVDMVMVSAKDIIPQFRDEFRFGEKVKESRYASDIDSYLSHPIRVKKEGYTYLFANRLVKMYNPIQAIEIFCKILSYQPDSKLLINSVGPLRNACETFIEEKKIRRQVTFLDHIESWDSLHKVYQESDILIFPATFSNGNFTIIEAMASGMGIIISKEILGIGKLIINEYNGFSLPVDTKMFVRAALRYIDEPDLFRVHALKNRELVRDLNPAGTAKIYYELITPLLTMA